MAQTAQNGRITLAADTWTLISEINCTFVVEEGEIEILGMDGAAPGASDEGVTYFKGQGEDVATDTLSRFVGSGTPDRIYAISRDAHAVVFVSRAAVA